jgi:hypothetical protein
MTIRVLIADDQELVRPGFSQGLMWPTLSTSS